MRRTVQQRAEQRTSRPLPRRPFARSTAPTPPPSRNVTNGWCMRRAAPSQPRQREARPHRGAEGPDPVTRPQQLEPRTGLLATKWRAVRSVTEALCRRADGRSEEVLPNASGSMNFASVVRVLPPPRSETFEPAACVASTTTRLASKPIRIGQACSPPVLLGLEPVVIYTALA